MSNPKISVIVPVYNAESTIRRCVDSILAQTFTDFECLLIDDGSKDRSGEICDEYAEKDSRVRVFHKENGGVSSARNVGLDNAIGEWLAFIDSDDWVGESYLESFSGLFDSDMLVMNGYNSCSAESCKLIKVNGLSVCKNIEGLITSYLDNPIIKTPWAKLFRKEFLLNMRFEENLRIGEDLCFVCSYMSHVGKIAIVDITQLGQSCGYFYTSYDCNKKYKMTVQEAVNSLKIIFASYKRLKIRCLEFEKNIVEQFYVLCQEDIWNNGNIWYNDRFIQSLLLKNAISSGEYLKIFRILVASFPGVFRLRRLIRKI